MAEALKQLNSKDQKELPGLMTELEKAYSIPALSDMALNWDNEDVIRLYRAISSAIEL